VADNNSSNDFWSLSLPASPWLIASHRRVAGEGIQILGKKYEFFVHFPA
jgi:hypothetical protein